MFECSFSWQAGNFSKNLREGIDYVGREYTQGSDIRRSLENRRMTTVAVPMPLIAGRNAVTDTADRMIHEKKIYVHVKRKLKL